MNHLMANLSLIVMKIREGVDLVVGNELRGRAGIEMEQSEDLISFLTG